MAGGRPTDGGGAARGDRRLARLTLRVRGLLRRRGRSAEDAEDLVQDAFARVEAYGGPAIVNQEAFLVRTALNLNLDRERQLRRRSPHSAVHIDDFILPDESPAPDEVVAARERLEWMKQGLAALNPRTRDILLAHRLDGTPYAEIARQHGMTAKAVEKHIVRGVDFLRQWMDGL
jgi:RNA polymerase sigma-70 factor (ECF subfamily)